MIAISNPVAGAGNHRSSSLLDLSRRLALAGVGVFFAGMA